MLETAYISYAKNELEIKRLVESNNDLKSLIESDMIKNNTKVYQNELGVFTLATEYYQMMTNGKSPTITEYKTLRFNPD